MTNRHFFICALLAASPLWTGSMMAQTMLGQPLKIRLADVRTLKAAPRAALDDAKETTVLIDEDFSGFPAGTEDEPDDTKLVNDLGDFTDPSALRAYSPSLSYRTWGGEGLYAAGGAIAIKDGWFLNTPAGDMSGDVTLTFRARLAGDASQVDGTKAIDLIFLSRKSLIDYERRQYDLTGEWQTFTFTSDKGSFEATGFQFMCNTSATVLIDDIRLEKVKTSIAAPQVVAPVEASEDEFTAAWLPTTEADEYLLDVYTKSESGTTDSFNERFASIVADADGVIDADAPNYPAGWDFGWGDPSKPHLATTEPDGVKALIFSDEGDRIDLPRVPKGLTKLSFWVQAEPSQEEVPYGSCIQLSFDTDYGLYAFATLDLADLLADDKLAGATCDLSEALAMFDGVYSLRLEYFPVEGDETRVLLSDFTYAYPTPPARHHLLQDQVVEARELGEDEDYMTFAVTGLDPDSDYYYTVRARNTQFTSDESDEVEVYTVSRPTVLEPTDVTDSCYTAHWTSHKKVDLYRVEQIQTNTIQEDTPDFEILSEDFSRVVSDFKEADIADGFIEQGEYTDGYRAIDDLTHIAGWKGASLQWVEGWLGGMPNPGQKGLIAGAISTPVIDLSHNGGECTITVRAWGQEDDWLAIQGANVACYGGIRFPEGGFVEATVTIPCCTAKESLTFYSNNYMPFLIDYIRIAQDVKAGDRVSVVTSSLHTADATEQSVVMSDPNFGQDHEVAYRVTGLRYRHGDVKDIVASAPSELMVVENPTSAVRSLTESETVVKPVEGGIVLSAAHPAEVVVLTLSGQTVAKRLCVAGTTRVALPSGMYIVCMDGCATKVVVR